MSGIKNRTIFTGDNLYIMRGFPNESADLIYLDPPFNSNHNYAAPIGSKAAGAAFKDTWTLQDVDVEWWGEIAESNMALYKTLETSKYTAGKSAMSYLIYMAIRILEMHRILKETGSIYLHCDPTMSHYLKMVMDAIFGRMNFRNEIVWKRTESRSIRNRGVTHNKSYRKNMDVLLFYAKQSHKVKPIYIHPEGFEKNYTLRDPDGRRFKATQITISASMGRRPNQEYAYKGYTPKYGWLHVRESLERLDKEGKIYWNSKGNPQKKIYLDEARGIEVDSVWTDISQIPATSKERLGYPTQKPLALLERIIEASSNEGDVVLDPFCGCATACSAAEKLDRKWIGIDISPKAYDLLKNRLVREAGLDKFTKGAGILIHRTDIPVREGRRSKCIKNILYGQQEGKCNLCCHWFEIRHMDVDHVIPKAKGGIDDDKNLQLLCGHCNRVKGTKTMSEARVQLANLGIEGC